MNRKIISSMLYSSTWIVIKIMPYNISKIVFYFELGLMHVLRSNWDKNWWYRYPGDEDKINSTPKENSGEVTKCCLISRRKVRCQKKPLLILSNMLLECKSVPLLLALNIKSSSFFLSFPEWLQEIVYAMQGFCSWTPWSVQKYRRSGSYFEWWCRDESQQ